MKIIRKDFKIDLSLEISHYYPMMEEGGLYQHLCRAMDKDLMKLAVQSYFYKCGHGTNFLILLGEIGGGEVWGNENVTQTSTHVVDQYRISLDRHTQR